MVLLDILKPTRSATEEAPSTQNVVHTQNALNVKLPKRPAALHCPPLVIHGTCAQAIDDKQMDFAADRHR